MPDPKQSDAPDQCDEDLTGKDEPQRPSSEPQLQTYQVLGLHLEMCNEVIALLRKLPYETVDAMIKRLSTLQVINVTRPAPGQH